MLSIINKYSFSCKCPCKLGTTKCNNDSNLNFVCHNDGMLIVIQYIFYPLKNHSNAICNLISFTFHYTRSNLLLNIHRTLIFIFLCILINSVEEVKTNITIET